MTSGENVSYVADNDEDVRRQVEPVLDLIMEGFGKNDYELYSKHFDRAMKEALPESRFEEVRRQTADLLGSPVRREYLGFLNRQGATHVLWKGRFSGTDGDVLIELTCSNRDGAIRVSGFWYR